MPLNDLNQSNIINTNESVNPGTSTQITTTCCTPPPSCHSINFPLSSRFTLSNDRGAPPTYEEAIDPNVPPPSYDLLFGRIAEHRKTSKGVFDFLKNIIILLFGTIGCAILIGLTIVVPVAMIVIGGIYLNDCPQGEYIPIYLLVGGAIAIFKQLLHLLRKVGQRPEDQSPMLTLINCFIFGWFITGSMWVYKEYEPNYDPALGKYCNKTLYLFAFWLITSMYIILGVSTAVLCSISVASIAFERL
ncbi:uncharacterized protein LOC143185955 isoform X1 [Calliopsis andreniformis]|uniref:uncharacterized protein LOC143185955 isoform X1 n=1 Tax=Calliopsis andreniformis TaxID=337506 RepID=UPI003FCEA0A8